MTIDTKHLCFFRRTPQDHFAGIMPKGGYPSDRLSNILSHCRLVWMGKRTALILTALPQDGISSFARNVAFRILGFTAAFTTGHSEGKSNPDYSPLRCFQCLRSTPL